MTNPRSISEKQQLRARIRRLLREAGEGGDEVLEAVSRWVAGHPDRATLVMYAALPGEVDLLDLPRRFPGRRWVLPRVEGAELMFHAIVGVEALKPGAFGILEPGEGAPEVGVWEVDVFFCPGLAFDARGGRLGRGRGFYDRMLARARPEAWKVGVCRQLQRVDDTFAEPHDIFMDEVISR